MLKTQQARFTNTMQVVLAAILLYVGQHNILRLHESYRGREIGMLEVFAGAVLITISILARVIAGYLNER